MFLPVFICLFVCLTVSKIIQKVMGGFGLNFQEILILVKETNYYILVVIGGVQWVCWGRQLLTKVKVNPSF